MVLALFIIVGIAASTSLLLGYSRTHVGTTYALHNSLLGEYACDGALAAVRDQALQSSYDYSGNIWLRTNSSREGTFVMRNEPIGKARVDVTLKSLAPGVYRAVAVSTIDGTVTKLWQDIRDRDTFARYLFFVDVDSINFGTSTVRGFVHSNQQVNFFYGGARFYKEVTAVRGFGYYFGANPGNTYFYGGSNPSASRVSTPSTNEIATLKDQADGVYKVSNSSPEYSGLGSFNTELRFTGGDVTITARSARTGAILKQGTYPLPSNGLIFVEGNITSLSGDVGGRVTVACLGKVTLTDRVRLVDDLGDPAFVLTDRNGTVLSDTPPGVVWDGVNYLYQANPAFNPQTWPTLGILAAGDVVIADSAPYNMEMHAAIFSSTGRWYCSLGRKKGNLRVLGSMVTQLGGWRYSRLGYGYALSGEYLYDESLLSSPPPFYLKVNRPIFGPRFKGEPPETLDQPDGE